MKIPTAAQIDMLRDILRDPCTARLYVNSVLPDEPTASDFTEPEGGGYAAKPVQPSGWDFSEAPKEATYPKLTWLFDGATSGGPIQGYYLTRNSDGRLRGYEPLSGGPMRIVNDGDQISVSMEFEFADGADEEPDGDADDADEAGEQQ